MKPPELRLMGCALKTWHPVQPHKRNLVSHVNLMMHFDAIKLHCALFVKSSDLTEIFGVTHHYGLLVLRLLVDEGLLDTVTQKNMNNGSYSKFFKLSTKGAQK